MTTTLEPSHLKVARAAQGKLRDAEQRLDGARRDFETAVRRLYVEGGSTRDIAEALDLSHQRIHQLVGAQPQTWWQRLTGTVREPDRGCSFCGKAPKAVAKLVAGPSVYICDACIDSARVTLDGSSARRSGARFETLTQQSQRRCSFCGKRSRDAPRASASGHQICKSCVELAQRIVADQGHP